MKQTFLIISIMLYAVLFNAADVRAEKTESKS
jgi:hypothetical protein